MAKLCAGSKCRSEVDELVPSIHVMSYQDARSFLNAVGPWLRAEEETANTILPYAEMLATPNSGPPSSVLGQTQWVVCWSLSSPQPPSLEGQPELTVDEAVQASLAPQLRFVLMVAESHLGPLPLFVFAPKMSGAAGPNDPQMIDAMKAAASTLAELRPPQQTLSMFGPTPLVQAFAAVWDAHSVSPRHPAPLQRVIMLIYSTKHCTGISVSASGPGNVRVARASDIATLTGLTQLSFPTLTAQRAHTHALHLLKHSQVWVHEIQEGEPEMTTVTSLCEVGRRSATLAIVTNLVSAIAYRRQGHAARLLTHVIQRLTNSGITSIVMYVPSEAPVSECMFRRLGFEPVDETEWVELSYQGAELAPW